MKNYGVTVDEQKTPLGERKDLKIWRRLLHCQIPPNLLPEHLAIGTTRGEGQLNTVL